jgi:hypothetical protein
VLLLKLENFWRDFYLISSMLIDKTHDEALGAIFTKVREIWLVEVLGWCCVSSRKQSLW